MNRLMTLAAMCLVLPMLAFAQDKKMDWKEPPAMQIDPARKYVATFETSQGKIVCDLFAKEAPKTVNNFVFLAKQGFYDGTEFHRVIPDFMIQGGDRNGNPKGTGDAGYKFDDETDAATNPHKFQTGTLAMANSGPNTNGSQFFITERATSHLQGKHTVFGQVTEGQDIVKKIATVQRDRSDKPREPVTITKLTISES